MGVVSPLVKNVRYDVMRDESEMEVRGENSQIKGVLSVLLKKFNTFII